MPQSIQSEWDAAKPATPEQEWESATPIKAAGGAVGAQAASGNPVGSPAAQKPPTESPVPTLAPAHDPIDFAKMSTALITSHMTGMPASMAYDNHDQVQQEFAKRGAEAPLPATIANDIKVGGQNSIFGLAYRQRMPQELQHPGMFDNLVTGLSELIADLPVYLAGGSIGAAAGTEVPVIGNVAGAAMGTFAVPAALRKSLMLGIEKGEITSFGDLMKRTMATTGSAVKGAALGLVLGPAGKATAPLGKALGPAAPAAEGALKVAQQAAALEVTGSLLEGRMPTADGFTKNAALIGALSLVAHGVPVGKKALMDVYAKDGTPPEETATKLQAQPPVKPDMPEGLKPAVMIKAKDGTDQVITGEHNTHADLIEAQTGEKPVTLAELEAAPKEPGVGQSVYINRDIQFSGFDPNKPTEKATYIGDAAEAGFPDRYLLQRVDEEGNPAGKVAVVRHELGLTDKEAAASFTGSGQGPQSSPINRVLNQPRTHSQDVIDRAYELRAPDTNLPLKNKLKSGRGFTNSAGDYLPRNQAKSWVKENEPDVYAKWAEITGDEKAEFHSADYAEARERVAGMQVAQGENAYSAMSPENAKRIAAFREDLNNARADVSDKTYGERLRTFIVGQKDLRTAIANNLRRAMRKALPDAVDREALTFMRDYRGDEQGLQSMLDAIKNKDVAALQARLDVLKNQGEDEYVSVDEASIERMQALIPAVEKALAPTEAMKGVDAELTKYAEATLDEAKGLGIFDSSIPPDKYITHILREADAEESTGGLGRPKLATKTPYGMKRGYPTTIDAMIAGKVPRTLDALDAIAVYGDRHAIAVATRLFATELKNSELGKWGTQSNVPADWQKLGEGKLFEYHGMDADGKPFTTSMYVPKKIAEALKPITERKTMFQSEAGKKFRKVQSQLKAAFVGLSVFHVNALTHSSINNMGIDVIKTMQGSMESPEFRAATEQWSADGLITSRSRTPYEVYKGLEGVSALEAPGRMDLVRNIYGIKQLNQLAEKTTHMTFDIIQTKYKVTDAVTQDAAWMAKHPDATDAEHFAARRSIAKEVNAVYGGLNWEALGWGPNATELLRAIMLAPDWSFSNVYSLKYAMPKKLGGEGGNPGGKAARMFWFRSAVNGLALTQATSLFLTGQMSKNPTQVYLGKDDKGKEMYSSLYFAGAPKDFITQLNAWKRDGAITGTAEFLSYKLGPLIGTAPRLLVNKDWSGKPIIKKDQSFGEKTGREAMFAAGEVFPAPFLAKTAVQMLTDPEKDYTYKDFLLGLAGAPVYHRAPEEGKRKSPIRKSPLRSKVKAGK